MVGVDCVRWYGSAISIGHTLNFEGETMDMIQAMWARHTVRQYRGKPIPTHVVEQLEERLEADNREQGTAISLMTEDSSALGLSAKLVRAKGVRNYFTVSGNIGSDEGLDLDYRLGYAGADLMLYAQTLGLNTWWVGGTYNRKAVARMAQGDHTIGIIAVGYGAVQGEPHRSKRPNEVSRYGDAVVPGWFSNGVEAALLAPTGLNRQPFMIEGAGNLVTISPMQGEPFTGVDVGIAAYHFMLGAGSRNFEWQR